MKTQYFLLIIFIIVIDVINAQIPNAIPYQAAARNNSGELIQNQNISLRFTIHNSSSGGPIVYQETANASTNQHGLFSVSIGQGTVVSGNFSSINWSIGNKFLRVELDVMGGSIYSDMGVQQMLSVPYALNGLKPGTTTGQMLYWNGSVWLTIHPGSTGETLTMCNGVPTWGNCLQICTQVWMQKNLDVSTYRNGDPIPQVTDPTQWSNLTTGAWCYYENNSANGAIYGKLYNWYAVADPRGLAPEGWHIPSVSEWTTLQTCVGGSSIAGGNLKETGTLHWAAPNTGATNSSGFTALPGGYRNVNGVFLSKGLVGYWWSSDEFNSIDSHFRYILFDNDDFLTTTSFKTNGFTIRCVRD